MSKIDDHFCTTLDRLDSTTYRALMRISFTLSVISFTFTAYIILFKSPNLLRFYRFIIVNHIIWCELFETLHTLFTSFDTLIKVYGFEQLGFFRFFLSARAGIILMGTVTFIMLSTYIHMLYYILLRILPDNHFLSKFQMYEFKLYFIIYIGGSLCMGCIGLLAFPASQNNAKLLTLAKKNICKSEFFESASITVFYMEQIDVVFCLVLIGIFICISLLAGLWKISFQYWHHSLIRFSKHTREVNRILLQAIFTQTGIVCITVLLPTIVIFGLIIFSLDMPMITRGLMLVIAQHSTLSHVILLTATKPYRQAIKRLFRIFQRTHTKQLTTVSNTTRETLQNDIKI